MKKQHIGIFALLMFFAPFFTNGQVELSTDFDVKLGEPYKVVDAKSKRYFAVGDNKTLSIKTDKETVFVQMYSYTKAGSKELDNKEYKKELPRGSAIVDIIQTKDNIFYVYSVYNKKEKNYTVFCRNISPKKGTLGSQKELFTTKGKVNRAPRNPAGIITINSIYDWGLNPRFEIMTSYDDSKFLIRYRNAPLSKKDAENYDVLGFHVFDGNMKKVWGKEVKMPYTEEKMNNLTYGVLSSGDAFMIARKNEAKELELLTINKENSLKAKKIDISGDYNFMKINLEEDPNGELVCAGLYSEGGINFKFSFGGGSISYTTNGIFYFKMTPAGKVISKQDYEFPLDIIQQYISKRLKKRAAKKEDKGKAGIEDLKLVETINQEDGSTIFVCERQYARQEMWGTDTKNVYHFSNILIMKVSADGKLTWIKKIPKNQAGINGRGQMSIKYMKSKGYHYILYVDNPKNLNITLEDVPATHKDGMGGFLTACKIDDANGKYEKHTVLDMRDIEGKVAHQFNVTRIYEADPKEQIFMMETYLKGKKDAMIKIQLNK
jgi:hypothetical protein